MPGSRSWTLAVVVVIRQFSAGTSQLARCNCTTFPQNTINNFSPFEDDVVCQVSVGCQMRGLTVPQSCCVRESSPGVCNPVTDSGSGQSFPTTRCENFFRIRPPSPPQPSPNLLQFNVDFPTDGESAWFPVISWGPTLTFSSSGFLVENINNYASINQDVHERVVVNATYESRITARGSAGCVGCRLSGLRWGDRTGVMHSTPVGGNCTTFDLPGDGVFYTQVCQFTYVPQICGCVATYCGAPCHTGRDNLTGHANDKDEPMLTLSWSRGPSGSVEVSNVSVVMIVPPPTPAPTSLPTTEAPTSISPTPQPTTLRPTSVAPTSLPTSSAPTPLPTPAPLTTAPTQGVCNGVQDPALCTNIVTGDCSTPSVALVCPAHCGTCSSPTGAPTVSPSTLQPSTVPVTVAPSTLNPVAVPTASPTVRPSLPPTASPTPAPTTAPSSSSPTQNPTGQPASRTTTQPSATSGTALSEASSGGGGSNSMAIIGAVVVLVVLAIVLIGFIVYRRQARQKNADESLQVGPSYNKFLDPSRENKQQKTVVPSFVTTERPLRVDDDNYVANPHSPKASVSFDAQQYVANPAAVASAPSNGLGALSAPSNGLNTLSTPSNGLGTLRRVAIDADHYVANPSVARGVPSGAVREPSSDTIYAVPMEGSSDALFVRTSSDASTKARATGRNAAATEPTYEVLAMSPYEFLSLATDDTYSVPPTAPNEPTEPVGYNEIGTLSAASQGKAGDNKTATVPRKSKGASAVIPPANSPRHEYLVVEDTVPPKPSDATDKQATLRSQKKQPSASEYVMVQDPV